MKRIYRAKDFYMMEVRDRLGGKLGIISGLSLDLNSHKVDGFFVHCRGIKNETKKIDMDDVIAFNDFMLVKVLQNSIGLNFNKLKGMEVYDLNSNLLGKVEEVLFNIVSYKVLGIILTTGFLKDILKGKRIPISP